MTDSKREKPELTIVGGQPHGKRRRGLRGKIEVPVGLEKALYDAARDHDFKRRLLADPKAAIEEAGVRLRPSELAMIAAVSSSALEDMIDRVVPENARKRKFMGLVANAAASLAAGTVLVSCHEDDPYPGAPTGIRPDTGTTDGTGMDDGGTGTVDGGTHTGTGTGTGTTGTGTGTDTATGTGTSTTGTGTGTPTATATDTDTGETTS